MAVTSVTVVTAKFAFGICNDMVNSDAGTGIFLLILGIWHMCGQTQVQLHMSLGMDRKEVQKYLQLSH